MQVQKHKKEHNLWALVTHFSLKKLQLTNFLCHDSFSANCHVALMSSVTTAELRGEMVTP